MAAARLACRETPQARVRDRRASRMLVLLAFALLTLPGAGVTGASDRRGLTIDPKPAPDWNTLAPAAIEPASPAEPRYETNTHAAIAEVALRRSDCAADAYLKDFLMITQGIEFPVSGTTLANRVRAGAIAEDGGVKWLNHFYDPTSDSGLRDVGAGMNSLQWAWDSSWHDEDWNDTRDKFYEAVSLSSRSARNNALSETFLRLGHVVHLVEDLAQPQHTRNDAHAIGGDYEAYCSANYGSYGAVLGLPTAPIPSFSGGTSPIAGIPAEFANHWDTGQYTGQAGFLTFASTPGLAEYSNAYYITDDTMFGNTRLAILRRTGAPSLTVLLTDALENSSSEARHLFANPHIRNTTIADHFPASTRFAWLQREGVGLAGAVYYADLAVKNGAGAVVFTLPKMFLINDDNEIGFDAVCYDAWAHDLIPKAVSYSAGLVNYFFRGKIGLADPTTTWDSQQKKNQIEIRNDSNEAFGTGTWKLFYDDVNGNRAEVPNFDASEYSGLGAGASFTARFPEMLCDGGYAFTLVFKGRIGNEDDAVAARSFYTADELWVGTHYVPSGSELCFDVTAQTFAIFHRPTPDGYDIVGWLQFEGSSDLFPVSGTCNGDRLEFGIAPECGSLLSGDIVGSTLTNGSTCCWYCPLDPPPSGPWFCGTVSGMERVQ